jgi:hypothetical protein
MAAAARVPGSFANLGPASHPPFYADVLRLVYQVFGIDNSGFRLVGIVCFLIDLILIYYLSQEIFKDRRRGILASLIFVLHPLAIQGSLLLDIDNTVLTVLLMLTCLYYVKEADNFSLKNKIFLSLLFFVSLWAKLGTPFILMGSIILFHLFKKEKIKALEIFFVSIGAILIFLLVLKIDSAVWGFSFGSVFKRGSYIIAKGIEKGSLSAMPELTLRILRVFLWLGPYLIILWIVNIIKRLRDILTKKEQLNFNDLLIIYSVFICVFYILIGGTSFGFAKYHYPMLPILSIIIANAILSLDLKNFKRYLALYLLLTAVFLFINKIFSGDLLYQVNYTLRKIGIFSPTRLPDFYKDFAKRTIFYFLPFILGMFLVRLIIRKESWFKIFSFLAISCILLNNLCFNFYLRNSKYFTTYCYGRDIAEFKRVAELCQDIAKKNKNAKIIAPEDLLEYAGQKIFLGYEELWNDRDKFLQAIKDKRVKAVIYNFTFNALFSYKEIFFNPDVEYALKNNYSLLVLGEYHIWARK